MSNLATDELIRTLQKYDIVEAFQNKDFFALERLGVTAGNFTFIDSDSIEFTVLYKRR